MEVQRFMIPVRLASLPASAKLMLTLFLALMGVGYLVAVLNIFEHHTEADLEPGLKLGDLQRVYHGMEKEITAEVSTTLMSPMQRMVSPGGKMRKFLERGGDPAVRALMTWLEAGAHEDAFAKAGVPQTGDPSPQAVIAGQCIRCHNMQGDVADIPYAMEEDSQPVFGLVSKKAAPVLGPTTRQAKTIWLAPTGRAELVQITHAHILAIPVFTLIVGLLFFLTGIRPAIKAVLGPLPMLAICFDFASWWLARPYEPFVFVIAAAGGVFGVAFGLQILCVFGSLWFGERENPPDPVSGARHTG